jgi:hypothetical protein
MNTKSQISITTRSEAQQDVGDNSNDSAEAAHRLLSALYPERFNIQGSLGITSKALGFSVGDKGWFPSTQAGIREAASYAATLGTDVYFHCSTHNPDKAKRLSHVKKEKEGKSWNGAYRGHIESAAQLTSLWADIDLKESRKENGKNYPSLEIAMEALERLPLPPSIVIFSGNGIHAYWLLDAPVDAQEHQHLLNKWQVLIKGNFIDEATGKKFELDSTQDVARVLRIPGTTNSKGGKQVKIIEIDESKRYSLASVEALVEKVEVNRTQASNKHAVAFVLDPECKEPACLGQLRKSPKFRATWDHNRDDLQDQTLSGYDLSIAFMAAAKEFSDQAICDLLVVHRREHGDDEKIHRPGYFQDTIARVRTSMSENETKKDSLFGQFAYVLSEKRFYERKTLHDMDKEQFADKTARVLGSRNGPNDFLERKETLLLDSVTYLVNGSEVVNEGGYRKLNLWDRYIIDPKEGDVGIFLDHMNYIFGDDRIAKEHMLDVMAHQIQKPEKKILHAPLIIGSEGVGKSILGAIQQNILGPGNTKSVDNTELSGTYNDWIRNTALVIVEELMTLGRVEQMNKLKSLITQHEVRIQRKFVATITQPNRTNFMFFSNHIDAAKLEKGERRYFVHISNAIPESQEYYTRLWDFVNSNDGIAAIAHYLHARDISKFNPSNRPPVTTSKELVIQESRSPLKATLHMLFEEEHAPFDKDLITIKDAITILNMSAPMTGSLRGLNPNTITQFLRDIGAEKLGQKRIGGKKPNVWAIRRQDLWGQASEKAIEDYFEPASDHPQRERQALKGYLSVVAENA